MGFLKMDRCVIWKDYIEYVDIMIDLINFKVYCNKEHYTKNIDYIYGIPRGGLIPATILSYKFNIPLFQFSNTDKNRSNKTICLVDDILDSGKTLRNIITKLYELDFKQIDVFTIFAKPRGIKNLSELTTRFYFVNQVPDEEWVCFPYEMNPLTNDSLSTVTKPM
jgi:adenine/guanine phosphoribosyltransferase-like PRPP-binding protein